MIIGGADLYGQTIERACRLEITRVHARPAGDSIFPAVDPAQWRETGRLRTSRRSRRRRCVHHALLRAHRDVSAAVRDLDDFSGGAALVRPLNR